MTEAVQIAICVAGASLVTQLFISWVQPYFKEKTERKAKDRLEIRQCFGKFFGLLGAVPSGPAVHQDIQQDIEFFCPSNAMQS